jgi:hypothetical protein
MVSFGIYKANDKVWFELNDLHKINIRLLGRTV